MPHLMIDYSPNLEDAVDMAGLCNVLRQAAIETGVFPMPGVRVRAFAATHTSIADGNPDHGYIDISVRLREGRSDADKTRAAQALFAAAETFVSPALATRSLALSLELRDIDADLSPKTGSIRKFLGEA